MPVALIALAIGAFGIGTTEFVIVGLLPDIAGDLSVSIPTAGLLVSGYAISVAVGAPLLTAAGSRLPRKTMLLALMGLFVLGNALCAVAGDYAVLMTGRAVAALCHGAFFGIGSVVAADLVAPRRRASAIALMFTGLTVANVLGVPLGTAMGQHFGWRSTFWAVTALSVLGLAGIARLVPRQPRPVVPLRSELLVFRSPQVWLALLMATLGFGGVFAAFTYIAPMLTHATGVSSGTVTWLLVVFGIGLCVGNLVGGWAADRNLMPNLYLILVALAAVLIVFVFTVRQPVPATITILFFGITGFATVPPFQARMMTKAAAAPTLASTVNIAAFNLGNAIGAWLGGLVIDAHFGYASPNVVGALLVLAGLGIAVFSGTLDRLSERVGKTADMSQVTN
ncbi:MAG TPA: MFS transporter [Pseudonocardiaceae bacterium]|nr:MFS transporter [Pseudonocardiaceae bacterium]